MVYFARLRYLWLLVFMITSTSYANILTTTKQTPPAGMVLIAGIGQSNMFGAASIPIDYPQTLDPRIWTYDPRGWSIAHESVHEWLGAGIGPMLFMARRLLEKDPSLKIGLIACGSPGVIQDWLPGAAPVYNASESNYDRCLRLIQEASQFGIPAGILVYQGEADTVWNQSDGYMPPAGATWKDYYIQMIISFRADLQMPMLPAVHAQLAKYYCGNDAPDWDVVKNSQANVILPFSSWIPTDDIPLNPVNDCIHHTIAGYEEVGKRFADAWWKLNTEQT